VSAVDDADWVAVPVGLPAEGRTAPFAVRGEKLLLCNAGGAPHVVRDECSHARTSLAGGRLCGFILECPLHGGKIDVRDGSPAAPPVRAPVAAFAVRRRGDTLEVALPPTPRAHP
jgi:nitrite reductase/ring-hydroxylating ferredoxin subunit